MAQCDDLAATMANVVERLRVLEDPSVPLSALSPFGGVRERMVAKHVRQATLVARALRLYWADAEEALRAVDVAVDAALDSAAAAGAGAALPPTGAARPSPCRAAELAEELADLMTAEAAVRRALVEDARPHMPADEAAAMRREWERSAAPRARVRAVLAEMRGAPASGLLQ